jgi:hypothetical protein
MTRENKQGSSEAQIRSVAERDTEVVRSQSQRTRRSSFGAPKLSMAVTVEVPGYHLCWMNDDGKMIDQALDSGYEFVVKHETEIENGVSPSNVDMNDKIKMKVGTFDNGAPIYGYLMKIKNEWFEEDQEAILLENRKIEDAIAGGNINGTVGQDGKYVSSISIKRS